MKSSEERRLENKIRMVEDKLLRCKDFKQELIFRNELAKMRKQAQKLYFQRIGS